MIIFKKIRGFFFRLILLILISLILFIAAALIISSKYEDEIKEYTVNQINEQLNIKINVKEAEVSGLDGFPYISVIFKDVIAWSNPDFNQFEFGSIDTDTLFSAERVYIQFSLKDLIIGKYRIKRIYASTGKLHLLSDNSGKTNFNLFKAQTKHAEKSFSLELQAVRLSDFDLSFNNLAKNIKSSGYLKNILFKGKISDKNYSMASIVSLNLHTFQRDGINYADNDEISTKLIFNISDSLARIKKGELMLNNIPLDVEGSFILKKNSSLQIDVTSRGFDLGSIKNILTRRNNLEETPIVSGRGDLAVKIQGNFSRLEVPSINAVYLLQFDQIKYKDIDLRDLSLKGKYGNGKDRSPVSSYIAVEKFTISNFSSDANGVFNLNNFKSPVIEFKLSGKLDAGYLMSYIPKAGIEDISGALIPDLILRAQLTSFSDLNLKSIKSIGLSGNIGFEDLLFRAKGKQIDGVNGEIRFAGDSWYPEMIIKSEFGSIACSLQADDVMKYILGENRAIYIYGKAEGKNINLDNIKAEKERSSEKQGFSFPKNIYLNLQTSVDSFKYRNFVAEKAEARLNYKPGFLTAQEIKINCMRGEISGNGAIIQNPDKKMYLRTQNTLKNVDIHLLFNSFNNFNQKFIVADNLKGYLSGEIDFATAIDSSFHIISSEISTDSHLSISSGELNHFEPMKSLSKFIALEELENIRFSTIENTFSIRNEIISIPQMDIQSNAFNVIISGRHGFDNNFDYKLKVNLSEILASKARKAKKENEEFGVIESENRRTSLYLSIIGNPDDYKIKYDKKEAVSQIKEDISKEKQSLKQILNEEFGWFKNDSIVPQDKTNQKQEKFIVIWDEEPEKTSIENDTKKKKKFRDKKDEDSLRFEWDEENK